MNDISSVYGYSLLILGLIIAVYPQWKLICSPSSKPIRNINQNKWNQISWFAFFSFTMMGSLLLFIDTLWSDVINYRVAQYNFDFPYSIVDIILILHVFVNFWLIINRVEMQITGDRTGKFLVDLKNKYEFGLLLLFLPSSGAPFTYIGAFVYLGVYLFLGGSVLMIILTFIPIFLTKKIFEVAKAY